MTPELFREELGVDSLDDFIKMRGEWYRMKVRQCLVILNILDLPREGSTDPLDHYAVLSELQERMYEKIREMMTVWNYPMRYIMTAAAVEVRPMQASKGMSFMRSLMDMLTAPPVAWKKEPWGSESTTVAPAWTMAAAARAGTPASISVGAKV